MRHILTVGLLLATAGLVHAGPFTLQGTQPVLAHPILPSSNCNTCHGNYDPANDIEPNPTWQGSLMAQSTRDPLFWAALDVANNDAPGVGDFCLRCHAPAAWFEGRSEPPGGSTDGCGLQGKIDQQNTDFDGVTCHLCHRAMENPTPPPGQQSVYLENGQLWLDDGTCGARGEPCRYGPYDYSLPGMSAGPHAWAFSTYIQSAEMCGSCHNVTNPAFNLISGGVDQGIRFPIERTQREWSQSDYAQPGDDFATCQDCHMPSATADPAYASSFELNNHTGNMGTHGFAGGNAWVPQVLKAEYPALGLGAELDASTARARAMLAAAATVTVDVPGVAHPGDTIAADVAVTNLTGHKLPTGYPEGRRMWLHVEARDANGTLVFESGAYDAATGVLTRDPQIKVYEAKQGVWNAGTGTCETSDAGRDLFHFVKNNCVALDNRIPPKGFTGGTDLETNPVGYTYPEIAPGVLSNTDVTTYSIAIPTSAVTPVTVTATLRYQTTSKEYVEFLRDEAVANAFPDDCIERTTGLPGQTRGEILHEMWQDNGRAAPETIAAGAAPVAVQATDAFTCAKSRTTKGTPSFVAVQGLTLTDAFGSGVAEAKQLAQLCAPADTGDGILEPATWLTAFKLKGTAGAAQSALGMTDALGSLTVATTKPLLLMEPTALGVTPPAAPGVDDFTCYKAKTASGTPKLPKGLQITASSAMAPARVFDVKALQFLCVATDLGDGFVNPAAALSCYKAKPVTKLPAQPSRATASDLATLTQDAVADALVCLPATVTP